MLTAIIPTKNHGIYLENLLENVLFAEKSPVTQLLICNDASTDDTAAILARYSGDKRIRVFENKASIGAVASDMMMYPHLETPYVMFMSTDDFFFPEQLAKVLDGMIQRDAYLGFGKYMILEGEQFSELNHPGWQARGLKEKCDFEALFGFDHYAFLCTTILHKDFLPKHGANNFPFDLSLDKYVRPDGLGEFRGLDWDIALEMASRYPDHFYFLDEYCGCFRKVANQLSSDDIYVHTGRSVYEMALLILKYLPTYELRQRIKSEPYFHNAVKNLFYAKFAGVTEAQKQSKNFQEIYKPIILAADAVLNNM